MLGAYLGDDEWRKTELVARVERALKPLEGILKLRDTKEIVLAAVTEEGCALRYASPELRGNKSVVMRAIEKDAYAYYHASAELRADKHVALKAGVPSPWRDALRTQVDMDMRARVGLLD